MTPTDPTRIKQTLRRFILGTVPVPHLDDDTDLFASGIVNSLFAVQLMTFVEKTFAIEVATEDLDLENFKSLNATAAFVARRSPACASH